MYILLNTVFTYFEQQLGIYYVENMYSWGREGVNFHCDLNLNWEFPNLKNSYVKVMQYGNWHDWDSMAWHAIHELCAMYDSTPVHELVGPS